MGNCSLCGGQMAARFSVCDHLRLDDSTVFLVEWCDRCAYGKVSGEFDAATIVSFHRIAPTRPAEQMTVHSSARKLDRWCLRLAGWLDRGMDLEPCEIARTLSLTGNQPTLCDVGCGVGKAMRQFSAAGYEVTGVEPDQEARKQASLYGQVLLGTAESLPEQLIGEQFNVVLLSHVLECCKDPVAALVNVKQLLAPGGIAVIEIPNSGCAGFQTLGPGWLLSDVPRHLHFFTRQSLDRTLKAAGFKVVRRIYTGYARQMSAEWLRAEKIKQDRLGMEGREVSAWNWFARTVLAGVDRKYDSIRVHAIHT
jgi:2-polyprenyl-3-methyl-5-hydroxy-6-metoxy-1,4-benzoquinol methylase